MTKLEQVARAISSKITHDPDFDDCMAAARAAVEALEDPPQQAVEDAVLSYSLSEAAVREYWRAMLDAILSEKPDVA